jgi:hypothetical protein
MGSLDISGDEETYSEQQLRDRLRHLDYCIKAASSCRSDHNLPPAKRDGVEQLLGFLHRREMFARAILRLKIYARMPMTLPEDMEELSLQLLHLDSAHSSPFEMHSYSLRRYSSVELSRRVTEWREEILKEQPQYDALLILFGFGKSGAPLPGDIPAEEAAPYVFRSPWLQVICLALQHVGFWAQYKPLANWIADNHPYEPLPSYCNKFKSESRDIGWLVANQPTVAQAFMRNISLVRSRMTPAKVGKRRVV